MKIKELTEQTIKEISKQNSEPQWFLQERLTAFHNFKELPPETDLLYAKYVDKDEVDISEFEFEEHIKDPSHLTQNIQTILSQYDLVIINTGKDNAQTFYSEEAKQKGIKYYALSNFLREKPKLAEEHFKGIAKRYEQSKFASFVIATALNTYILYIPENTNLNKPIYLLDLINTTSNSSSIKYNLVYAGENSKATVIFEDFSEQTESRVAHVVLKELRTEQNATLLTGEIQALGSTVLNISTTTSIQGRDSSIHFLDTQLGSKTTFAVERFFLNHEGATTNTYKCIFADENQNLDFTSTLKHIAPYTQGHSWARIVVKDSSKANFKGMVRIDKDGLNTDSSLIENSLIIGKNAKANAIPALEILTNEVKASHAATVSQLDEEQVFYSMSRGIPRDLTEKLLIRGYFEPSLSKHPSKELQEIARKAINMKWDKSLTLPVLLAPTLNE